MGKANTNFLICDICGVDNGDGRRITGKPNKYNMILCSKHYGQMQAHSKITDKTPSLRSRLKKNEYILYDDYAEICIYNRQGLISHKTIIDIDDMDKCKPHKWGCTGGYIGTRILGNRIWLHKFIKNVDFNYEVDHIDNDVLNNRRHNLRQCTHQENTYNRRKTSKNTSGIIGVHWDKSRNKWCSMIKFQGRNKNLGRFTDVNDAIRARREAEQQYFGEFAPIHSD